MWLGCTSGVVGGRVHTAKMPEAAVMGGEGALVEDVVLDVKQNPLQKQQLYWDTSAET